MIPFSEFIISSFERDEKQLLAKFHYSFDNKEKFTETINFAPLKDKESFPLLRNNPEEVKQILTHIHIALGVSYYKLFPTKTIKIQTIALSKEQEEFWLTFYQKGLGEFYYQNQLHPRTLEEIISKDWTQQTKKRLSLSGKKDLVLFGGGKDSLVTLEVLKEQNLNFDLFSFGKDYPLHQLAQIPTEKNRLIIQRNLDLPQITRLLKKGYYNGHVPITGSICFVSLLVCYLYGYQSVFTSLEKSADEGNTIFYDMPINHQWSKSSEFEHKFKDYVHKWIISDFQITSLLRERYEIKVVQEFCKYPKYFQYFSSCNRNFHQTGSKLTGEQLRCGICPKCAFIYTLLRAFLGKEKVNQIFARDLFEDAALIPLFEELLGISGIKPFECVGTNEEMILAFRLIFQQEKKADAPIMKKFLDQVMSRMTDPDFQLLKEKLLN